MLTPCMVKNSDFSRTVLTTASLFGTALALTAADATLTNRTDGFTREMSTDRPDMTESPYTVEAGHWQMEIGLVDYVYEHENLGWGVDARADAFSVGTVNLKYGLCPRSDLELVIPTYNHARVRYQRGPFRLVEKASGFGNLALRGKFNLWGNDGGRTALAVMPVLELPTASRQFGRQYWQGGIILPLAVELPAGWDMGVMTAFAVAKDDRSSGYHPEFINTITFGHDIWGKLAGYGEFASEVSAESGSEWVGTANTGLTYALTENVQLDGGINFGVTRSAPDYHPFLGVSFRF